MALPILAASGDPVPCPPTRSRRRRRRGREGGARRRPEQRHPPRSHPRGGAGPAGATHACDPCFLSFLFVASTVCFPYQRRLLPRHRVAHPFADAFTTGSPWTIGEHRVPPFPVNTAAFEPRQNVPRRAAAGDAGHRARLGCNLLQVLPPSSTRAPPA
jgi:hypothetical protein